MPLRCIVIDDEPLALDIIRSFADKLNTLTMAGSFEDAVSAGEFLRSGALVDLAFVDINMPGINGIQLLRSLPQKPLFIFTTAHKEFAFEGFEMNAVDYLLKPISFDRFEKAVQKATDMHQLRHMPGPATEGHLMVYSEYNMIRIPYSTIEYIESVQDYIRIYRKNSKPVMTLMPLKKVYEKLPENLFQRIHRSYIVAVNEIQVIQHKKITLASGTEIPVGERYTDFIRNWKRKD